MRDMEKRARARAISLSDPLPAGKESTGVAGESQGGVLLARTNTAPGALAKFMVDKSETHKENALLKAKLEAFEDAIPVKALDPTVIASTRWANRHEESFAAASFVQLKNEIAAAGGNVQPIKVRIVAGSEGASEQYEIVFGHRRHRACLELGIPVNAMIAPQLSDQQLYLEMERENRNREDLSAWEQGAMYARALEAGLFGSIRQLAAVLDRDQSQISKAVVLGKLPPEVISAFATPLDLQFRWATDLKNAVQKDPEGVLERARAVSACVPRPSPAAIFAMLTQNGSSRAADTEWVWRNLAGKKIASMKRDRKQRVVIEIGQGLDPQRIEDLLSALDRLLPGSSRG